MTNGFSFWSVQAGNSAARMCALRRRNLPAQPHSARVCALPLYGNVPENRWVEKKRREGVILLFARMAPRDICTTGASCEYETVLLPQWRLGVNLVVAVEHRLAGRARAIRVSAFCDLLSKARRFFQITSPSTADLPHYLPRSPPRPLNCLVATIL